MPIAKVKLPDGRVARFKVPEGTTQEQVLQFANQNFSQPQTSNVDDLLKRERTDWSSLSLDEKKALFNLRKTGQLSKINKGTAEEAAQSVISGMSGGQRFVAGMGKGFTDIGRGVRQLYANAADAVSPSRNLSSLVTGVDYSRSGRIQREIDEAREYDKPLTSTGAGLTGDISSKVISALPTMFIPGANTVTGSALVGAGLGMLDPVGSNESRLANMGLGLVGGGLGQVAGRGVAAAGKGLKAIADPFRKKGQELIAARTLREFAGDADKAAAKLANAQPIVPGSMPTAAEAAGDAGIAQLQRSLANQNPQLASELAERALDQNAARLAALNELTKYGNTLDDAVRRRAEAGAKLYEKAFGQKIRVDETIASLAQRPSFQNALQRAQRIAQEEGVPINNLFDQNGKLASTRALHYVKMGFDDLINDATASGIGKTELNAIKATRGKLLDWMSENNPAYKTARVRFEKMSRPINRQEVVNEITSRASRNQLPNPRGQITLYPDSFAGALKGEGEMAVRRATGRVGRDLDDVMTPKQIETLKNIRGDLSRSVTARDMGRAVGSNTAQNLASQNLLRQILGPTGLSQSWSENALLKTIVRPAQFAAKAGEENIQEVLSRAMLDPKYAAGLLAKAKPRERTIIRGLLADLGANAPTAIGASVAGLLNQ